MRQGGIFAHPCLKKPLKCGRLRWSDCGRCFIPRSRLSPSRFAGHLAYAVAAGLAIAVLGGYLAFRAPQPSAPVQLAEEAVVEQAAPAPESVAAEPVEIAAVQEPAPAVSAPVEAASTAVAASTPSIKRTETAPRARFEMAALTRASDAPESQAPFLQAPALGVSSSRPLITPRNTPFVGCDWNRRIPWLAVRASRCRSVDSGSVVKG